MAYRVVFVGAADDPLTDPVVLADTDLVLPLNVATVRVLPRRVPRYSAYVYPWPAGRSVVTEILDPSWERPPDYIKPRPPDLGRPRFIPFDEGNGSGLYWFVKERHVLDSPTSPSRRIESADRLFVSLWDSTYAAAITSGGVSNVPFLASLRANHIELPPLVTAASVVGLRPYEGPVDPMGLTPEQYDAAVLDEPARARRHRAALDQIAFTFREADGSLPKAAAMLRRGAGFWGTGSYEAHVAPLGVGIDRVGNVDRQRGLLCFVESRRVLAAENQHPAAPGEKIWRLGWAKPE